MKSMQAAETLGFKWGAPAVHVEATASPFRTSSLFIAVTAPKQFSYFVVPMIKGGVLQNQDFPTFQLHFRALNTPCQ
jgi:hypothetical protein